MIRIKAGTFGHKQKGKPTVAYTVADGEIDLKDKKLEARLVKDGIAEYVVSGTAKTKKVTPIASSGTNTTSAPQTEEIDDDGVYGIEIEENSEAEDEINDGEQPPDLNTAPPETQ